MRCPERSSLDRSLLFRPCCYLFDSAFEPVYQSECVYCVVMCFSDDHVRHPDSLPAHGHLDDDPGVVFDIGCAAHPGTQLCDVVGSSDLFQPTEFTQEPYHGAHVDWVLLLVHRDQGTVDDHMMIESKVLRQQELGHLGQWALPAGFHSSNVDLGSERLKNCSTNYRLLQRCVPWRNLTKGDVDFLFEGCDQHFSVLNQFLVLANANALLLGEP